MSQNTLKRKNEAPNATAPRKRPTPPSVSEKVLANLDEVDKKLNNNALKSIIEKLKIDVANIDKSKVHIGFFGGKGCGKSTQINDMLGMQLLPTSADCGTGCTQFPIKCSFHNGKKFEISYSVDRKDKLSNNTLMYENLAMTADRLKKLNNDASISSKIEDVHVSIPMHQMRAESAHCLPRVVLIDMIGVPDRSIENAYLKNSKAFAETSLDCVFIVKNVNIDRGEITPSDIEELDKCKVFEESFNIENTYLKYVPQISLLYYTGEVVDEPKMRNYFTSSIKYSLSEVFNLRLPRDTDVRQVDDFIKIKRRRGENMDTDGQKTLRINKKVGCTMLQRCEALVWCTNKKMNQALQESKSRFGQIVAELLDFKCKVAHHDIMASAFCLNRTLMYKHNPACRRSRNETYFNKLYTHLIKDKFTKMLGEWKTRIEQMNFKLKKKKYPIFFNKYGELTYINIIVYNLIIML